MRSDAFLVKLDGVDDLKVAMATAAKHIRTKAVRAALRSAARVIQADAKARAPVLVVPTPYRKTGTVKGRITVRASKTARRDGNEGVYINVRPLRGVAQVKKFGKAGAKNPNDPFYWRFLEFGTRKMQAKPFLRPAAEAKGNEAISVFMRSVVPQIERLNNRVGRR